MKNEDGFLYLPRPAECDLMWLGWVAKHNNISLCYLGCGIDQYRNPNINNRDHLVGQLTIGWAAVDEYQRHKASSYGPKGTLEDVT